VSELIKKFRAEHPQYDSVGDDVLVPALHNKFYSNIPFEQFTKKIGYQPIAALPQAVPQQSQPMPAQAEIPPQAQAGKLSDFDTTEINASVSGLLSIGFTPDEIKNKYREMGMLENNAIGSQIFNAIDRQAQAAAPKPLQQAPMQESSVQSAPIQQASTQPQMQDKPMIDLVLEKLAEFGGGVAEGFKGVLPQAKLQVAGMLQQYEKMSPEEFEKDTGIFGYKPIKDYETYSKLHIANSPVSNWLAEKGKEIGKSARVELNPSDYPKGSLGYYSSAITGSVMNMVPAVGVSLASRRPDIGLGIMMTQAKGGAYETGRMEGLTPQEAQRYSLLMTAAEVIPSAVPVMALLKPSGKLINDLIKSGVSEAGQEGITQALQSGIDKGYIKPDMTFQEALDRMIEGAIIGAGSGTTMSLATSKVADNLNKRDQNKQIEAQIESEFDSFMDGAQQEAVESLSPDSATAQKSQTAQQKPVTVTPNKKETPQAEATQTITEYEQGVKVVITEEAKEPAEPKEEPTKQKVVGKEVVEAPIEEITLSKDVPQFKSGADSKGVVEPLGGTFERTGVAPIQIWVREDGKKEVISGRHRLDLAKRSGEKTIPAQYHYESEGFGLDQAAALDATLNIREGQGKVKDYVDFIKATKPREAEAKSQGLLARQTGKRAFTIATKGSDELIASHRNDQVTDEAAERIANAAPRSSKLQAVGIKAIQEGKTIANAENLIKAVSSMSDGGKGSADLFGFDDSAMIEAEALAKNATAKQAEIQKTLSAIQGAAKRPELAKKEGIDIKDAEAVNKRIQALKEDKAAWQSWHTNPKLVSELKGDDFSLAQETEAQRQERESQERQTQKQQEEQAKTEQAKLEADKGSDDFVLQGSDRPADVAMAQGQKDIFADQPKNPEAKKGNTEKTTYTAASYDEFMKTVAMKTATKASIESSFNSLVKNKDSVIAELNSKAYTKTMLQSIVRSPRSDFKKATLAKLAYERMLYSHVMSSVTTTFYGGSKTLEEQLQEKVNNQTQADIDAAYERQREYRAEREKAKQSFVKALTNPETLDELKEFIRVRGKENMTAEQLAAYDELVSESIREGRAKPEVVEGEKEVIETERAQTKHSKTNADLFVVKMLGRVSKEKFRELSEKAKQLGGYYSSYSKDGAIPGFQFKSDDLATQFENMLSGKDINKSDFIEAKADVKRASNADKLIDMADKLQTKAEEAINQPRQSNTARRASMAANATQAAEKKLALAKTIRSIAEKMQQGELVHLSKLSQVTQLEELISVQNAAIPSDLYESPNYDGYSINRALKQGVTVEDYIRYVDMPGLDLHLETISGISKRLKGQKGYMRLSAELERPAAGARKGSGRLTKEQAEKVMQANKVGIIESYHLSFLPDRIATVSRLERLGISTGEQLRAAIRELDSLKAEARAEDPVKKLERDLVGKKIPGFFPTPKTIVENMIDMADIKPGHEVLEPSAGKGNIAQEIKLSAPNAKLDVVEFNAGLSTLLKVKGFNVVGSDFLEYKGKMYDRIIMNPPFENFQDIDHVKHAYSLLKPGGKIIAIMGAGVKNSRSKAVEFREWLDDMGSYIEDLPEGSFKNAERSTGVNTVMVTIEKNDTATLNYKSMDNKVFKSEKGEANVFQAPGHNFIGMHRSLGIPERREFVTIEGRKVRIPEQPQRIEPIMRKMVQIAGRRIYFGKIKGKSAEGFYRPNIGEIRTRRKNDVEVLAHELAHYLDMYSNVSLPNFKRLYKDKKYVNEVKALSYTDATDALQEIEGFAEFVRLWLTNAKEAQLRAPKFYTAFTNELARDRKLLNPMRDMQDLMHKFYFQGPDKLGQALIGKNLSFMHRMSEWAYRRDSRIRQQVIDRFHAARKIEQELTGKINPTEDSAWKQFRIANGGGEGIADYILNYGTLNFDEKGDLVKSGASLNEILQPVKSINLKAEHKGEQKIDLLMRYLAGRRALELHRQGRENLIPKETALEWVKLGTTYPQFVGIHKEYQAFNDRMMDFYEESGMITPEARKAMQTMNNDYVPFNRIRDQLAGGKGGKGGFQRLKGGTANLNDILVNIQDGVTANVRSALNNRAKQRLYQYISNHKDGAIFATKIAPDSKKVSIYKEEMQAKIEKVLLENGLELQGDLSLETEGLLEFWQHGVKPQTNESGNLVDSVIIDGKPKYYEVQDPLLQEMLLSMNPESYSSFMNIMFGIKNIFTRSITLGIEFTGANLVRDTIGASFLSKNGFVPFASSFRGMYSFIRKDADYQAFMRSGGGYSSRIEAATREGTARRRVSVDEFGVMTGPEKILSTIDNIASAFEYGTRIGEFRLAKKNGLSDMDAGFSAREISTDFSAIGANRFLTGYIRTVPFLNAMIQSQDRVFREIAVKKKYDGNPVGLTMKAFLGITLPSLFLYLINKDDDDYKEIPDYEKRTNWHIKINEGQFAKIPRPYDVGFVFATMPELFFKYLEDEKGKEFADGMLWTMTQMYGIDGVPAAATGWWDLVRNKKWTGAPVVPQSLENVEAPDQYTSNTSETFIRMGEALGISPIKAEHVFKAYTGYLGGYLMAGTDKMLWDESKFGERPDSKLSDNIFLKRFLTPETRPSTAAMEKFFNLKEKSDSIVATFKQEVDIRRSNLGKGVDKKPFKNDKFYGLSSEEKQVLFALNDSMNDLIKVIYGKEGIKTAELVIKHNKRLTGEQKREQIDKLWKAKSVMFLKYYEAADRALQAAKLKSDQEK
jgi:ubiquinone/menaquinone biosynthesis C-methylase UbiE